LIDVDSKVIVGCSSAEKKSVVFRWVSRSGWLVSTLVMSIVAVKLVL
jgi:hypothetical protein